MSAWPQAAWIVKKLQKNFDFSSEITYYTQNLNTLNGRVNALNSAIAADEVVMESFEDNLDIIEQQLDKMASVIRAKKSQSGVPEGTSLSDYAKGTLWLVLK